MSTGLTKKELFIVDELSHGFTRREIAGRQYRSEAVVKKHIAHAMEKLRARNAVHLISIAKDYGLIAVIFSCLLSSFWTVEQVDIRKGRVLRSFSVRDGRVQLDEV